MVETLNQRLDVAYLETAISRVSKVCVCFWNFENLYFSGFGLSEICIFLGLDFRKSVFFWVWNFENLYFLGTDCSCCVFFLGGGCPTNVVFLRPVVFVVQIMSDISKQDCIHNERILQYTRMKICIHHRKL